MAFINSGGSGSGASSLVIVRAEVLTAEATSSASYVDLATVGPSATVTVLASGLVLVGWNHSTTTNTGFCSIIVSGANTIAASDNYPLGGIGGNGYGRTYVFTGLVAGSTTFKMQYKSSSGSVTFSNRSIFAVAF